MRGEFLYYLPVYGVVVEMKGRCFPLPCLYCLHLARELTLLPLATLKKAGPAAPLGITGELTMLTRAEVSQSREHEHGRGSPTLHLLYGDMGKRAMPHPKQCLGQVIS